MRMTLALRRLGAVVGLGLLLVSCSATRYSVPGPTGAQDLARYVLVIEEAPDGQVTHSWKPLKDFDVTKFSHHAGNVGLGGRVVRVAADYAHCDGRQQSCIDMCTSSSSPIPIEGEKYPSYLGSWASNRGHWCQSTCTKFHQLCIRGRGPWAERAVQEFTQIDGAVDWIKGHREEIVAGTLVVIAGVTFVAAVAGSGGSILFFAPLVVVASEESSPGASTEPRIAEVLNANP